MVRISKDLRQIRLVAGSYIKSLAVVRHVANVPSVAAGIGSDEFPTSRSIALGIGSGGSNHSIVSILSSSKGASGNILNAELVVTDVGNTPLLVGAAVECVLDETAGRIGSLKIDRLVLGQGGADDIGSFKERHFDRGY